MTEDAWRSLTRVGPLMGFAFNTRGATDRRRDLFACACCRLAHDWELPDREADALDAAERYLDGLISRRTWQKRGTAVRTKDVVWERMATPWERDFRRCVAELFYEESHWRIPDDLRYAVERVSSAEYAGAFERKLCAALRDIFGNPFRPGAFDPGWRTDTAIAIARQMYESRDFAAMPILADALQDTGCDDEDALRHCRDPHQVHVRGCWVVDAVLGKT